MEAIKIDSSGSVLIKTKCGLELWVDVWLENGELRTDWNQYILLNDPMDLAVRAFQEDVDNFDLASSLAIDFYNKSDTWCEDCEDHTGIDYVTPKP